MEFGNGEDGEVAQVLFDDFGHDDEVVGRVRRVGEGVLAVEAGLRGILTEDIVDGVRVGGRFDGRDIESLQLLDIFQHFSELGLEGGDLVVGEFDAGQTGDIADIKIGTAHAADIGRRGREVCPKNLFRSGVQLPQALHRRMLHEKNRARVVEKLQVAVRGEPHKRSAHRATAGKSDLNRHWLGPMRVEFIDRAAHAGGEHLVVGVGEGLEDAGGEIFEIGDGRNPIRQPRGGFLEFWRFVPRFVKDIHAEADDELAGSGLFDDEAGELARAAEDVVWPAEPRGGKADRFQMSEKRRPHAQRETRPNFRRTRNW